MPQIAEHAAKISSGQYSQEDIAFVVAGYNTYRDMKQLGRFCGQMFSGKYRYGSGMRLWLLKNCSEAE